jgi:hypothetical protein
VLVFVVTRDNPFTPASAQWTLSGIDAAQLADGALTGTVTFAAGQTEARISIPSPATGTSSPVATSPSSSSPPARA